MWPFAHIQWRRSGTIGIKDAAQKNSPKLFFPNPRMKKMAASGDGAGE